MFRKYLGAILRTLITVGILAYFIMKLDWMVIKNEIVRLDYIMLGLALLLGGLSHFLGGVRWWHLLKVQDIHLSLWKTISLTFIGQFYNLFLLGSVGGDVVKSIYVSRYAPRQKTHAMLSIIMDRVLGLMVMVLFALCAISMQFELFIGNHELTLVLYSLLLVFGAMAFGLLCLALMPHDFLSRYLPGLWNRLPRRHVIELLIQGFHQHGNALVNTILAGLYSITVFGVVCAVGICLAVAIGLAIPYVSLILIMTLVICITTVPISIGGHGLREGAFVLFFKVFAPNDPTIQSVHLQEQAIVFSLLFFLAFSLWGILGGMLNITGHAAVASAGETHRDL